MLFDILQRVDVVHNSPLPSSSSFLSHGSIQNTEGQRKSGQEQAEGQLNGNALRAIAVAAVAGRGADEVRLPAAPRRVLRQRVDIARHVTGADVVGQRHLNSRNVKRNCLDGMGTNVER